MTQRPTQPYRRAPLIEGLRQDIAGELVVSQLHGHGEIEPAAHLLCKSDPPPNGEQSLLLG